MRRLVFCLLAVASLPARAEPVSPAVAAPPLAPAAAPLRHGFFVGLGLGFGNLRTTLGSDTAHYGSFLFDLRAGGLVNPRLALGLALWGASHTEALDFTDDLHISQPNFGVIARFWLKPALWLEGGAGTARFVVTQGPSETLRVRGASLRGAIGYELLHRPSFALDGAIGLWAAGYRGPDLDTTTTGTVELGVAWY